MEFEQDRLRNLLVSLPTNQDVALVVMRSSKSRHSQSEVVRSLTSLSRLGLVSHYDVVNVDSALDDVQNLELSDKVTLHDLLLLLFLLLLSLLLLLLLLLQL